MIDEIQRIIKVGKLYTNGRNQVVYILSYQIGLFGVCHIQGATGVGDDGEVMSERAILRRWPREVIDIVID